MNNEKGSISASRIQPEESTTGCEVCGENKDLVLVQFNHNRPTIRQGIALCREHREKLVFVVSGFDVLADAMSGGSGLEVGSGEEC